MAILTFEIKNCVPKRMVFANPVTFYDHLGFDLEVGDEWMGLLPVNSGNPGWNC